MTLQQQFSDQNFANEYELVNGVAMHTGNPDNFQIPPDVIKRHVSPGQYVELRIDSPRFSVREDPAERCFCPSCNGDGSRRPEGIVSVVELLQGSPMKLGVLTDIHEHVENLRTALERFRVEQVDRIVVIGDVFEMGHRIKETCQLLSDAKAIGVWGNHD